MHIDVVGDGFQVDEATAYDGYWESVRDGLWEPGTLRAIAALIDTGDTFVDVGAWVGPTTLAAAACGACVHAFEPDPIALEGLRTNVHHNPELAERITVHPVALARAAGEARLTAPELGQSMSSLVKAHGEHRTVETRSFAAVMDDPQLRGARVLKIDIEGGEYDLLAPLAALLAATTTVLMLSTHVQHLRDRLPAGLPRLLRLVGLQILSLGQLRVAWHLRRRRHWYECRDGRWEPIGLLPRVVRLVQFSEKELIVSDGPLRLP